MYLFIFLLKFKLCSFRKQTDWLIKKLNRNFLSHTQLVQFNIPTDTSYASGLRQFVLGKCFLYLSFCFLHLPKDVNGHKYPYLYQASPTSTVRAREQGMEEREKEREWGLASREGSSYGYFHVILSACLYS